MSGTVGIMVRLYGYMNILPHPHVLQTSRASRYDRVYASLDPA